MKIKVNGKDQIINEEMTISQLIESLRVEVRGTAVAVNDAIISREQHGSHLIKEGDQIEILRAIGGG